MNAEEENGIVGVMHSKYGIVRLGRIVIAFTVGLFMISLFHFWQVVRPPRIVIPDTPAGYGLSAEDITITASDGVELAAWYIPAADEDTSSAVILLHGYPANKADMLRIAQRLQPHMSLLLVDLRYFGESGGKATTLGVKEPGDIREAVNVLQDKGYGHVGIFGFSFGGAVGLLTAAEDAGVTAVGAYAPYASLRRLGHDVFFILSGIKYPLVEFMNIWSGLFFGGFSFSASPQAAVRELQIPVLLVHSKEDEQIPFRHAEKLQGELRHNEQAEFLFLEEGRHGTLPDDFYDRLIAFFTSMR